ncbi:MAG: hypothetical protein FJX46_06280 [Alphaproteobacteria bacterium]|nr:hypothetical protein [Alphaproteobacteria bacterium]
MIKGKPAARGNPAPSAPAPPARTETAGGEPVAMLALDRMLDPDALQTRMRDANLNKLRVMTDKNPDAALAVIRRWMAGGS